MELLDYCATYTIGIRREEESERSGTKTHDLTVSSELPCRIGRDG